MGRGVVRYVVPLLHDLCVGLRDALNLLLAGVVVRHLQPRVPLREGVLLHRVHDCGAFLRLLPVLACGGSVVVRTVRSAETWDPTSIGGSSTRPSGSLPRRPIARPWPCTPRRTRPRYYVPTRPRPRRLPTYRPGPRQLPLLPSPTRRPTSVRARPPTSSCPSIRKSTSRRSSSQCPRPSAASSRRPGRLRASVRPPWSPPRPPTRPSTPRRSHRRTTWASTSRP